MIIIKVIDGSVTTLAQVYRDVMMCLVVLGPLFSSAFGIGELHL